MTKPASDKLIGTLERLIHDGETFTISKKVAKKLIARIYAEQDAHTADIEGLIALGMSKIVEQRASVGEKLN